MLSLGLFVCGALCIAVFCGCEDGPDMNNVGDEFDGSVASGGHGGETSGIMVITPDASTVANNSGVVSFRVQGASGAATWSVQDISKGSILTQSATTATYRRAAAGDNVVIATDAGGNAAFATVSQP
jgi:hypothetical protein